MRAGPHTGGQHRVAEAERAVCEERAAVLRFDEQLQRTACQRIFLARYRERKHELPRRRDQWRGRQHLRGPTRWKAAILRSRRRRGGGRHRRCSQPRWSSGCLPSVPTVNTADLLRGRLVILPMRVIGTPATRRGMRTSGAAVKSSS